SASERDEYGKRTLIIPTDGQRPRLVASFKWPTTTRMAFSSDGAYLAYDAVPGTSSSDRDVFVVSLDSGAVHAVVSGPAQEQVAGWLPDGQLVIAADRVGVWGVWRQPMHSGAP